MVLDNRARHELFLRLEQVLGPESAEAFMEMMPPVGRTDVATKRDLDALEQRMKLRLRGLEHKMLADVRGDQLAAAVTAQTDLIRGRTKTLLMINLTTVLSAAVLVFGATKLT
jgi:hypothetical protein